MTKYTLFQYKRIVEEFIMFPFIFLGRVIAHFKFHDQAYDIIFFFPSYTIGGAERINAEIIRCFPEKKLLIIFTKKPINQGMKHFFEIENAKTIDISSWIDNKFFFFLNLTARGVVSSYINSQKLKPIIFNGQSNFGYKILPHLKSDISKIELIHAYDDKFTWVWAPFIQFIDKRIVISDVFIEKYRKGFIQYGIPLEYIERMCIIIYKLEYIPSQFTSRQFDLPLKVYYAGRGGRQKRLWILFNVIKEAIRLNLNLTFHLAGPFEDEIPNELLHKINYVGNLNGGEEMYQFHRDHDILLMTSAFEGFPVVIMEGISWGTIPLVPAIDSIPDHINHGINGILIQEVENELKMRDEIISQLTMICNNSYNLQQLSQSAFEYSKNFTHERFYNAYRKAILGS